MTTATTDLVAIGAALAAGAMTYLGGRIALRVRDRTWLIVGATAGVVIGIALFDLLPEAFAASRGEATPRTLFAALACGLVVYLALDRLLENAGGDKLRAHIGPASLTLHSFFDGFGIGVAFLAAFDLGLAVTLAVLAHDLADGATTVGLSMAGNRRDIAHRWLLADSAAPIAGVIVSGFVRVDGTGLALMLAAFAGALLYLGTSGLTQRRPSRHGIGASAAAIVAIVLTYGFTRLI